MRIWGGSRSSDRRLCGLHRVIRDSPTGTGCMKKVVRNDGYSPSSERPAELAIPVSCSSGKFLATLFSSSNRPPAISGRERWRDMPHHPREYDDLPEPQEK